MRLSYVGWAVIGSDSVGFGASDICPGNVKRASLAAFLRLTGTTARLDKHCEQKERPPKVRVHATLRGKLHAC